MGRRTNHYDETGQAGGTVRQIKHVMLPVGAAMDVLEGLGAEMPDNMWISGRYYFLYPDNAAK